MSGVGHYDPLWVTRVSRWAGLDRVADRLGRPELAPYTYAFLLVFVDVGVLSTVGYLTFGHTHPLLTNPFWYVAPLGLWFAIWASRLLARHGADLVDTYAGSDRFDTSVGADDFYDLRRTRFKYGFFVGLLVVHAVNYGLLGGFVEAVDVVGPVLATLKFGLIIPFGYFPIIAEVAGLVTASFLMVPQYFVVHGYRLQFDDPLDLGGLEPVGDLIKKAVYIYMAGLTIGLLFTHGPYVFPQFVDVEYSAPGLLGTVQFLVAWTLGIGLLLYGTFRLHLYLQSEKRAKIEKLDDRIRELGEDDHSIPDTVPGEGARSDLEIEYLRLRKVKQLQTWPFAEAAQERIAFSVFVPIVLDQLLTYLLPA